MVTFKIVAMDVLLLLIAVCTLVGVAAFILSMFLSYILGVHRLDNEEETVSGVLLETAFQRPVQLGRVYCVQ